MIGYAMRNLYSYSYLHGTMFCLTADKGFKDFTGKQSYTHAWLVLGLLIEFIHDLSGDYFGYSGNQEVLTAHIIKV